MEMSEIHLIAQTIIEWGALLFAFLLGLGILAVGVMYVVDKTQTAQTIRRNYPVVGRFRYLFEHLGEFFRQYFFAMDREELPFNRAERSWVYRAAKQVDTTVAFGSTRRLDQEGDVIFLNSAFPTLDEDAVAPAAITIGEGYCSHPYTTSAILSISAMSYGAISRPAVLALAHGAREAGIWMNTGEGGLSPYHLEGGCDIVFQIGTAKYGVRDEHGGLDEAKLKAIAAHDAVRMFEIKMSQGAKPGKGGILPGAKVNKEIAGIRQIQVGQDSISPNGHTDVRSTGDLLDMIERVRSVTGKPTGFKAVVGQVDFFHELFREIHARGIGSAPDFITIDSADGGTGAAPQPLIDYMGMPLNESLPLVIDLLHEYGLRERIKVIASGKLISPGKVAWHWVLAQTFAYPRAASCLRWVVFKRCNATKIPALQVLRRTTKSYSKGWCRRRSTSGWLPMHSAWCMEWASLPTPVVFLSPGACSGGICGSSNVATGHEP